MPGHHCHFCGAPVVIGDVVSRESECESCRRDLRCCRNCRHFDERFNNSCRETMADPVEDKERRNFCEYFDYSTEPFQAQAGDERAGQARAKLSALFGDPPPTPGKVGDARAKLDALFGGGPAKPERSGDPRKRLDALFGKPEPEADPEPPS